MQGKGSIRAEEFDTFYVDAAECLRVAARIDLEGDGDGKGSSARQSGGGRGGGGHASGGSPPFSPSQSQTQNNMYNGVGVDAAGEPSLCFRVDVAVMMQCLHIFGQNVGLTPPSVIVDPTKPTLLTGPGDHESSPCV